MKHTPKQDHPCPQGLALLEKYLQALEANYRAHLPYIEALQSHRPDGADAYIGLIDDARERLRASRRKLVEHQESHGCTLVRPENFSSGFAA